jgi:hypothetical protein
VDLFVVKSNFKLWSAFEMFITTKVGLKRFNSFNLSQITYGLSKSGHGSKEFWDQLAENYIGRIDQIDKLGIAIMINSFGRSHEASLSTLLPAFRPTLLHHLSDFNHKEVLLVLSGIAAEASTKSKSPLDPALTAPIFERF